nr:MYB transcription factor protein [Rosa persica]
MDERGRSSSQEVHRKTWRRKMAQDSSPSGWSLIAGRLPGRTSNDVKNYWSARRRRNMNLNIAKDKPREITRTTIIRPRPRTRTGGDVKIGTRLLVLIDEGFGGATSLRSGVRDEPRLFQSNWEISLLGACH